MFLKNALLFTFKNIRDRVLMSQHFAYIAARLLVEVSAGKTMTRGAMAQVLLHFSHVLRARWRSRRHGDRSDQEILAPFLPEPQEKRV